MVIHDDPINQVCSYKYLGIHLDNTFSWNACVESLFSCLQHRLYFLRRLRVHGVDQRIMFLERIVRYEMSAWYGNLTVQLKSKLARLVQTAMKVMGRKEHQ